MYLDHLQNWLDYGHGRLIFPLLAPLWLSETGQIWVFGHFPENAWRELPEIWYADVSWPPSELIRLWLWSVDFSNFGTILTQWNVSNLGFVVSSWRTHRGNDLTFCMLMYPDHLKNWLDNDHSVLIFLILTLSWLSETGFQAFSWCSVDFPLWCPFDWNQYIWGFSVLSGERVGVDGEGVAEAYFLRFASSSV